MSPKPTTVLADASSAEVRDGITLQRRSAQLKHHSLMHHLLAPCGACQLACVFG